MLRAADVAHPYREYKTRVTGASAHVRTSKNKATRGDEYGGGGDDREYLKYTTAPPPLITHHPRTNTKNEMKMIGL